MLARFLAKITVGHGCWNWVGCRTPDGYGHLSVNGKRIGAHRIAWELANEKPVPAGMMVLHSCDNPPCVRPAHLEIGTMSQNARDSVRRGRNIYSRKTHCPQGHPYVGANLYVSPRGDRQCRTCKREFERRKREAGQ